MVVAFFFNLLRRLGEFGFLLNLDRIDFLFETMSSLDDALNFVSDLFAFPGPPICWLVNLLQDGAKAYASNRLDSSTTIEIPLVPFMILLL